MENRLEGLRVLVVEDEYFLAHDMEQALVQLGARVLGPVGTCDDALMLIDSEEDLALGVLDLNLQEESAIPVADRLAQKGIPFVFATGYDHMSIPDRHRDIPLWEKPFDAAALAAALPNLFGLPRQ